jgi:IS30 family transposase
MNPLGQFCLIQHRSEMAAARSEVDHFEGDLIIGVRNASAVVTLVDFASRLKLLGSLPDGHDSTELLASLGELLDWMPAELGRALIRDQGREVTRSPGLLQPTGIDVYFCKPHDSWLRASDGPLHPEVGASTGPGIFDQDDLDAVRLELKAISRRLLNRNTAAAC